MNNGSVDLNISGHIATLLINRPEKLNALTPEMLEELAGHCRLLETNTDVRVVVLKSASPKVFCVGADITRWNALTPLDMWRTWIRRGHQIFDALAGLPQPVIALMNGLSYGGGAGACGRRRYPYLYSERKNGTAGNRSGYSTRLVGFTAPDPTSWRTAC